MDILFWIYLVQVLIIVLITFYLEYRYMKKGTPLYVYFTVYIGWILGFVIIATLPFDIYTSSIYDKEDPTDTMEFYRSFTQWSWKILYVLTFVLTWFIFPFLMVYVVRGEFSILKKIGRTLLANLISYVIYIVATVILLLIIFFLVNKDKAKKDRVSILDVIYVISIVYGLLLIVFLMSYGLVAVPKYLWKQSEYKSRIKKQLYHISIIEEKLQDVRIQMHGTINVLEKLSVGVDMQPYLTIVKKDIATFKSNNPKFEQEASNFGYLTEDEPGTGSTGSDVDVANISITNLEKYRSKYMIYFGDYERISAMLEYNIRDVMNLQARVNAKESSEYRMKNLKGCKLLIYYYYLYPHPILMKIFAVIAGLLSLALLYAEFSNFVKINFSMFNWILDKDLGFLVSYFLMSIPLGYMLICTYFGLFSVKLASWYELYKGHTDPVSMLWSGTIFARLIYPMSYNFITIMKVKNTNYSLVLTILEDFTILGDGMNRYFFPIVLIIFFVMNLLNLWSRLFNACGLSQYSFDEYETEGRIKEGRITVDQRRKELYENGEIDEAFLRNTYSSDSENDSPKKGEIVSINSGVKGAVSPIKSRERSDSDSFRRGKVVKTKRNSFRLAVSDSESQSDNDNTDNEKVINIEPGKLRFTELE